MRIIRARDYDEMSLKAAGIIAAQVLAKPNSVLGLATGSTPVGLYMKLAQLHREGFLDFSRCSTVNLDEYEGLAPDNRQSYAFFMKENLFRHINIPAENCHIPNGLAKDADEECARYESVIASLGGIDLQLLGLGPNGHIGFNEPEDNFGYGTHNVDLTQATIAANSRFFSDEEIQPSRAYTMGIGTIMAAKKILLVVNGEAKAEILKAALFGDVTPGIPASILRFHHDVTVVADAPALSKIGNI